MDPGRGSLFSMRVKHVHEFRCATKHPSWSGLIHNHPLRVSHSYRGFGTWNRIHVNKFRLLDYNKTRIDSLFAALLCAYPGVLQRSILNKLLCYTKRREVIYVYERHAPRTIRAPGGSTSFLISYQVVLFLCL